MAVKAVHIVSVLIVSKVKIAVPTLSGMWRFPTKPMVSTSMLYAIQINLIILYHSI